MRSLIVLAFVCIFALCPANAEVKVVATIKPVHSLVAAVTAGRGIPYLLVGGANSPHTYAMKPSDARALQSSDAIFWVGPAMETFLSGTLQSLPGRIQNVKLMEIDGIVQRRTRRGEAWAGLSNADGHTAASASTHDHHGHEHGPLNPHIWLDPHNAKVIVGAVARVLVAIDPGGRDLYETNARKTLERLDALMAQMRRELAPVRQAPFLVFHDAYHHLEVRFDLNAVGAISLGDGRAPGARHVRALRERIESKSVACVFMEPQFTPRIVDALLAGTSARSGVLDPIGAAMAAGPDLYFTMMRENTKALAGCLSGRGG